MTDHRPPPDAFETLAERLTQALSDLLPAGADELRGRVDTVVESMVARLDLVPREAYERQLETLRRLEGQLTRLEARLAAIERRTAGR
jgi:BMFP domain-containing protein YqiC